MGRVEADVIRTALLTVETMYLSRSLAALFDPINLVFNAVSGSGSGGGATGGSGHGGGAGAPGSNGAVVGKLPTAPDIVTIMRTMVTYVCSPAGTI